MGIAVWDWKGGVFVGSSMVLEYGWVKRYWNGEMLLFVGVRDIPRGLGCDQFMMVVI